MIAGVGALLITGAVLISGINDVITSLGSSQRRSVKDIFSTNAVISSASSQERCIKDIFISTSQDSYRSMLIDDSLTTGADWTKNWRRKDAITKDDADSIGKTIDIPYWPIRKPVYFPENPNDFQPLGLIPGYSNGTSNGKIIFWNSPITNKTVFTWHENPNHDNGPHYHINDIDKGLPNKDHTHFYPGNLVPEPYASIYFFGGNN